MFREGEEGGGWNAHFNFSGRVVDLIVSGCSVDSRAIMWWSRRLKRRCRRCEEL